MADANFARFNKRVREIEGRHKRLASGYVRLEERDGLLVPVERVRPRRSLPLRGITLSLVAFLLFKGFLLAYLGPVTYGNRIAILEAGNAAEKVGSWIMAADPITLWIASQIGLLI
ncbi:hypothetical protein [Maritimibacter sp. HL-12]|jgi:hypothetical protein|uniref:hypothetical protein n=1 Tax=Maritimibacter sp. HL-12 TaxID=1162418 RepID=UPI000A0F3F31|nr:hypothetical protein [Maritimibacter sp. HL-12]SMH52792.1 hypothetical protein SAMN05661107_2659 [Maritimibacter sp. HL-12]